MVTVSSPTQESKPITMDGLCTSMWVTSWHTSCSWGGGQQWRWWFKGRKRRCNMDLPRELKPSTAHPWIVVAGHTKLLCTHHLPSIFSNTPLLDYSWPLLTCSRRMVRSSHNVVLPLLQPPPLIAACRHWPVQDGFTWKSTNLWSQNIPKCCKILQSVVKVASMGLVWSNQNTRPTWPYWIKGHRNNFRWAHFNNSFKFAPKVKVERQSR